MRKLGRRFAQAVSVAVVASALASSPARALSVAFLEARSASGQRVVLEPGGRFAHVAVSYRSGWLHAHPRTGVAWTRGLGEYGQVVEVLENPLLGELPSARVRAWLGLPYDREFGWSDDAFYCSELVAKLLGLRPRPMRFAAPEWDSRRDGLPVGELGISPDEIFIELAERNGWRAAKWLPAPGA